MTIQQIKNLLLLAYSKEYVELIDTNGNLLKEGERLYVNCVNYLEYKYPNGSIGRVGDSYRFKSGDKKFKSTETRQGAVIAAAMTEFKEKVTTKK